MKAIADEIVKDIYFDSVNTVGKYIDVCIHDTREGYRCEECDVLGNFLYSLGRAPKAKSYLFKNRDRFDRFGYYDLPENVRRALGW